MQSNLAIGAVAGALKGTALEILRITNDLRLLSSGPLTGIAEIRLPAVQPGSSIMPGKVNPAVPEVVAMVCFHVVGAEAAVAMAVQAGQLELNVMMPVMAWEICFSSEILKNAVEILRTRCIEGLVADEERCRRFAEISPSVITALTPRIGYAEGAEVVKQALREGKSILQVARERKLLPEEELERILDPRAMTEPGILHES
jgi:aspartate ammonia-lyase